MEYHVTKFAFAVALQVAALFFAWLASPLTLILAGMCGLAVLALRQAPLPLSYDPRADTNSQGHPWGEL